MDSISLVMFSREGCHLCDDAWEVITQSTSDFSNVEISHRMVSENPEWEAAYTDSVPVVLINDAWHSQWRVDADSLREALVSAGARISGESE